MKHWLINRVCLGPRRRKRGSGQKFQIRSKSGNKKLASVILKALIITVKKIIGVPKQDILQATRVVGGGGGGRLTVKKSYPASLIQ